MKNEMNNFPGVFVPREIVLNKDLSSTDKLVYSVIQSLDNDKGCYASNTYIGEVVGIAPETVRSSVAKLEEMKLIVRYFIEGSRPNESERTIRTVSTIALTPPLKTWGAPLENVVPPPRKQGGNNTRDNTSDRDNKGTDVDISVPHGEKFKATWVKWVNYRKERKKPLTRMTIEMQLNACKNVNEDTAVMSIEKSIEHGWLGIFFEKQQTRGIVRKPLTSQDHNAF